MSLERIAEILCVDEVKLMHGPKGVAVHVLVEKSWRVATIDNREMKGRRLEAIAEVLAFLSDAVIGKVRDPRRARADAAARAAFQADQADAAARAATQPEAAARAQRRAFGVSWGDVGGFDNPRDGAIQQQVVKSEPPPSLPSVVPAAPEGPAAETMPSRFHAIMAELRCL